MFIDGIPSRAGGAKKGVTIAHICLARRQIRLNQALQRGAQEYFSWLPDAALPHLYEQRRARPPPGSDRAIDIALQQFAAGWRRAPVKVLYRNETT